jgi:hypothetical protein
MRLLCRCCYGRHVWALLYSLSCCRSDKQITERAGKPTYVQPLSFHRNQDKFFKDRHYLDGEWGEYFKTGGAHWQCKHRVTMVSGHAVIVTALIRSAFDVVVVESSAVVYIRLAAYAVCPSILLAIILRTHCADCSPSFLVMASQYPRVYMSFLGMA